MNTPSAAQSSTSPHSAPQILIGKSADGQSQSELLLSMGCRHGLIAGATGTGKTVTLRVLAESFSRQGVPVFAADIKGDLSGLAYAGQSQSFIEERKSKLGIQSHQYRGYPILFWDVFGKKGHSLRATISELGPVLLARLLDLNEVQEGVLTAGFSIADDQGLLLLDLKDLRALLTWMADNAAELQRQYGNITKATIGAIQRGLLTLEEAGGDEFFGEPGLNFEHLMQRDFSGNGVISLLDATALMQNPRIYSTMLLWLLSELFERLPEVGDLEKPKLVFFFDEAHLLFSAAPKSLLEKIEQVVRLIRSKGVGVYFVTQNPIDVPDTVAAQLGNRVQHALRAFTEKDQKAVRAAAQTFRANPALNTATVITELAVGEALVSTLDQKGIPTPVQRILIAPPESRIGIVSDAERNEVINRSPVRSVYAERVDRESASELLEKRALEKSSSPDKEAPEGRTTQSTGMKIATGVAIAAGSALVNSLVSALFGGRSRRRQSPLEAATKSAARSASTQVTRQVMRGILGSLSGSGR